MTTRSGVENTVMYDVAKIDERFGLRPDQMVDYKALKGDPTDNIPGVPGVGEKTAAKLIRDFGDLDALFARLDEVTPEKLREKLREHVDQIHMGRELSRIVRDLPIEIDLEAARLGDYDRDTVVRLFREYEFRTLIERLPPMAGESAEQRSRGAADRGRERLRAGGPRRRPARGLGRVTRPGAARAASCSSASTSTRSRDPRRPRRRRRRRRARGRSDDGPARRSRPPATCRRRSPRRSSTRAGSRSAAPDRIAELRRLDRRAAGARRRRSSPTIRGRAAARRWRWRWPGTDGRRRRGRRRGGRGRPPPPRRARPAMPLVGHEVKPLLVARFAEDPAGRPTPVAFDTQIAAYILNAALRSQTIADVVAENLDQILPPATELPATARAGLEALSALAVREPLERRLGEVGLERLFREIELPLIPVLARMEAVGVALDLEALAVLDREFGAEIDRLEREIYVDVGHEFNLGSPKQLEQVLFFELNLPKGKRTKTGYSTDASVLEDLRPAHPMIDKLLEWRVYTKLRSTYVEALPTLIAEPTAGCTRPSTRPSPRPAGCPRPTRTSRTSRSGRRSGGGSGGRSWPASPDLTLLAADYSQIELRILAHVSGDEHLKDAFARNADIHRETAARVLHKAPEDDHPRRAVDGQDGQLRAGLRDERLRARDRGRTSRARRPRSSSTRYFAAYSGISYYMMAIKEQAKTPGLRRDAPRSQAPDPGAAGLEPGAARRGRADGDQHADPGDRGRHPEDRDDPGRRAGRAPTGSRARLLLQRPRRAAVRGAARRGRAAGRRSSARRWRARCRCRVPLTVDIKVGDDWEGMTPLTRADAIAAEAGELPARGAARADRRVGFADARASRGRDGRARPPPADHRRDDRRRRDARGRGPCATHTPGGVRRRDRRAGGSRRSGGAAKQLVDRRCPASRS